MTGGSQGSARDLLEILGLGVLGSARRSMPDKGYDSKPNRAIEKPGALDRMAGNRVACRPGVRLFAAAGSPAARRRNGRTAAPATARRSSTRTGARSTIAHDRRPWTLQPTLDHELDTYADDFAEHPDVRDAVQVGHSTGGGRSPATSAARQRPASPRSCYWAPSRRRCSRPTPTRQGTPIEAFDAIRQGAATDRSQFDKDLSAPFYGANRPGAQVSQGVRDSFWLSSMQVGLKGLRLH
jgi:hypothetical protein